MRRWQPTVADSAGQNVGFSHTQGVLNTETDFSITAGSPNISVNPCLTLATDVTSRDGIQWTIQAFTKTILDESFYDAFGYAQKWQLE